MQSARLVKLLLSRSQGRRALLHTLGRRRGGAFSLVECATTLGVAPLSADEAGFRAQLGPATQIF